MSVMYFYYLPPTWFLFVISGNDARFFFLHYLISSVHFRFLASLFRLRFDRLPSPLSLRTRSNGFPFQHRSWTTTSFARRSSFFTTSPTFFCSFGLSTRAPLVIVNRLEGRPRSDNPGRTYLLLCAPNRSAQLGLGRPRSRSRSRHKSSCRNNWMSELQRC